VSTPKGGDTHVKGRGKEDGREKSLGRQRKDTLETFQNAFDAPPYRREGGGRQGKERSVQTNLGE